MPKNRPRYIAIEGAIGVGKTTLARVLSEPLNAELLLEVFEENPFLSYFYSDPERYAFRTQVFFLLSRHRQQKSVIRGTLRHQSLVSDYIFDKDRLFAHLTLAGDELIMYDRVHAILSEQIPTPDLVLFLRASTDELMQRISYRDRAYERSMSREYIERLRLAYEQFFANYTSAPVLTIDTTNLNIVHVPEARAQVIGQVRDALSRGMFQKPLLDAALPGVEGAFPSLPDQRRIGDFQRWHHILDEDEGLTADPFFTYICLAEKMGELGAGLRTVWEDQEQHHTRVGNRQEARGQALQTHKPTLQSELADCLAYLIKLANCAGIDLETSYITKMSLDGQQMPQSGTQEGGVC